MKRVRKTEMSADKPTQERTRLVLCAVFLSKHQHGDFNHFSDVNFVKKLYHEAT